MNDDMTHGSLAGDEERGGFQWITLHLLEIKTRLPGAVPQPIGLFLFCIEFGWG